MRFYEFSDPTGTADKFILLLRNQIGRAASKKQPVVFNWDAVNAMARDIGLMFLTTKHLRHYMILIQQCNP